MRLVLDTSILIGIEKQDKSLIRDLEDLKKTYPAPPQISFMTYFEFLYGLRNKSIKNKGKLISFLNLFEVIHTRNRTAQFLARLKEKYELPLADLFIASQVMEENAMLITKDKDFERISEIEKIIF